jgi:NAD-dependent DNA ligase
MKRDDLTQIKHVGAVRMRLLKASGITSIKKLCETPLENLSKIEGIGERCAKQIKASAKEIYGQKPQKQPSKIQAGKKMKSTRIHQQFQKKVKILIKRLKQVNENLKPLSKKKYLPFYIDLKRKSKTLKVRLNALAKEMDGLSKKDLKKIINTAGALDSTLKSVGKKRSKKNYTKVVNEIQSFSKLLKQI